MTDPKTYYKQQLQKHTIEVSRLKKQLTSLSLFRLLVFLATGFAIYLTLSTWQTAIIIGVLGLSAFLFLLSKYTDLKAKRNLHQALVSINEEELKIASGDFHDRPDGSQFQDPSHYYSLDIDLFGRGSFFQFINRSATNEGTSVLANALVANKTDGIIERQKAIDNLAKKPDWRQRFSAIASLIKVETPAPVITQWLQSHQSFLPSFIKWLPLAFTLGSVAVFILIIFSIAPPLLFLYWLLLGLGITGRFVKKINTLATNTSKIKDTFRQYSLLLNEIENETFNSELLISKQKQIQSEQKTASSIFKLFSQHIDALDNRNNIISAIFGNGLFLWDIKQTYNIEKWIETYKNTVKDWFEVVSFFDAYNSLGSYTFNHPQFVFPEISTNPSVIKATDLGHPLLNKNKRVDSDLLINKQEFFIVTGANMAGKSTFLRTVSLHIVMSNVGLPVCAKASTYAPVKLITSMRTSDSLTDDSSYFFSELTRLKFIVDTIQKEPYFIILDEILKGTNSTDKAIGSRKFVEKLVASNATGIIATHDLSLCEIEQELKDVKNYYFDAEIINDELHFDYTLKHGICQNMNASFLLKKMEIV
jgi:DNA mismatch repair ATPase MutS